MAKKRHIKKKGITKNTSTSKKVPISNNINSEAIAAALSTINQPVLLKVCRLCETKDGPFLNIFDIDKIIAKKIEDVMPFVVAENDDLPHKICFRCSAKVEELHEFIQKCVKTQVNLRRAIGNKTPLPQKVKHRTLWEEKLNKSNISNDDICDALIKKAMESIKEPLKSVPSEDITTRALSKDIEKNVVREKNKASPSTSQNYELDKKNLEDSSVDDSDIPLKKMKLQLNKDEQKNNTDVVKSTPKDKKVKEVVTKPTVNDSTNLINLEKDTKNSTDTAIPKTNMLSIDSTRPISDAAKPFNILDHVSMIKVNGVGVLFQCKLCNRNFLKKEVVVSHGCAKNGGLKNVESLKDMLLQPHEPPKMPSVKYINTKISNEVKKPINIDEPITLDDDDEDNKPLKPQRVKPKIGPASKVKKLNADSESPPNDTFVTKFQVTQKFNLPIQPPVVQFPTAPSLNSRYKLLPGPNNTFTLIEEGGENSAKALEKPGTPATVTQIPVTNEETLSINKTKGSRKADVVATTTAAHEQKTAGKPYPVGLFQTVSHSSDPNIVVQPQSFTTPAMKKQSYTVVQTGNPSKLLISTKPQAAAETAKKRLKKAKLETKLDKESKEPFSVTLEDAAPPRDPGFFTFINVDPLLQPSYVLPTDTIIQESQITTSTNAVIQSKLESSKDPKYTCNICNEKFSREKKLLTHIQNHYSKMDQEDLLINKKLVINKRRGRPCKTK